MINAKDNYVAWVALLTQLDDAREHLEELVKSLNIAGGTDEACFAVHLGHVYAHLNRAWHSRNQQEEIANEDWESRSDFPSDLRPVG